MPHIIYVKAKEYYWRFRENYGIGYISKKARISKLAIIEKNKNSIVIKRESFVDAGSVLSTKHGGSINIGERCEIHHGALILSYGGKLELGDDCSVNAYTVLYGHGGLTIGKGVRIATQAAINLAHHHFENSNIPIFKQGVETKGVIIKDNVWIGAGAKILAGVTIGEGSIIGAGAVVTKSVQPNTINAGVPSREIGRRAVQLLSNAG